MKIGIDIDNTITDTLPILKQYCQHYNDTIIKRGLQMHKDGVASYNLYDWSEEENKDFCIQYLEEIVLQATPKKHAKAVIQELKKEGHQINIISARTPPFFKTPFETTTKFLKEKAIVYDHLFVGKIEKLPICLENHFDILIEDEPRYINEISQFLPVIVLDAPHNRQCKRKKYHSSHRLERNLSELYKN